MEPKTPIMLLLGRDIIRVHKVRQQINGPHNAPYAQRLDLGWVIVGNVCLGKVHTPPMINTLHTYISDGGRPTLFEPCPNTFQVKEGYGISNMPYYYGAENPLGHNVFQQTKDDEKAAPSIEDIAFLNIMELGAEKSGNNSWIAPLPFRSPRCRLPHNRKLAERRLSSLRRSLDKKPEMQRHFLSFMERLFENGHAEAAPPPRKEEECWYLPIFGVYHPKKPGKIRVVFDSSAKHNGVSLNDVLISGPDLNNTLVGVLTRFRKEIVAVTADIEQMFHCFLVKEEHRNFLRFLWYRDNDPTKEIAEYRMRVHVFGNSPSPAVAIYCLRQAVRKGQPNYDPAVEQLVNRNFYIDDCLKSLPTVEATVSLLQRTRDILAGSNLRLHKIASNREGVMTAIPPQDHANNLKDLDLSGDELPIQRSLGLEWDLKTDTFTFKVPVIQRPFTRRGVLSTLNSLYDPLGFAAPVTIQGKFILRELTNENSDWDSPLPQEMHEPWSSWRDSLKALNEVRIPRVFTTIPSSGAVRKELHIFCDASTKAIAAVAYLKVTDNEGNSQIGFIMGKAKLAPRPELSVPRLELCAALLATELSELISSEIDLQLQSTTFYTDSKVVLGYIHNETRRFYVYVSNRVLRIRRSSYPEQWKYVHTDRNPADLGTRSVPASHLQRTTWLNGPAFPLSELEGCPEKVSYDLINPGTDTEVRPQVSTLTTSSANMRLGSLRFERFSTWLSITRALANLIHIAHAFHQAQVAKNSECTGWHYCPKTRTVKELLHAKNTIIRAVQEEVYAEELLSIGNSEELPKSSPLKGLDPFIDSHGLLRIGGRASKAEIETDQKHPIIVPGKHHIGLLLVRHYHGQTRHQGRLFTEGAIRAAGFWIVGGKRCVSRSIYRCVTCRRLRSPTQTQKMADLPADRLCAGPPFTNIGLDVFGPWTVSSRRTRGGLANSKRWAVMFTCMSTRGIHIEVIESMNTSSFINALRRFFSIRGPAKHIRSDCGTNFVGACKELNIELNTDRNYVTKFLAEQGCTWSFNPPYAPHMGGAWERMIGITKKILDAIFLQYKQRLTHELLTTFLAEVTSIINARPLVPVSTDPDEPRILTPATLLTQKVSMPFAHECGYGTKDILKSQWKFVQHLAETFWSRWRKEYLPSIQTRTKWTSGEPNLEPGSIVLLKDNQAARNEWPLGLITRVFPGEDKLVRKVEVKVSRKDGTKHLFRPVTEIVLLCDKD